MLQLIKFRFTEPLHLANNRADYIQSQSQLHSDTLYASIMQMWSLLGLSDLLDGVNNSNGRINFTLSSAFPYTKKNGLEVFFMPRIAKPFNFKDKGMTKLGEDYRKEIKKIEWLSLKYFIGQCTNPDGCTFSEEALKGKYLCDGIIDESFMESFVEPKVTIPRGQGDAEPYYLERIYFKNDETTESGLFCIFEGEEKDFQAVKLALDILQYEGFGTDRNTGNGKFQLECLDSHIVLDEIQKVQNNKSANQYSVSLSLYNPTEEELQVVLPEEDTKVAFELLQRGGWITTPEYNTLKKKSLFFFKEGSIFKTQENSIGRAVDIRPYLGNTAMTTHPVWRIGKSLLVSCIL